MARPDSIMLAQGHSITSGGIRKKRSILDMLPVKGVLDRIGIEAELGAVNPPPGEDFFESVSTYKQYTKAASLKDWRASDSLVLATLTSNVVAYHKLLEAEEWSRAFNGWLCRLAGTAPFAYRWIDPEELESLRSGTFRNKTKEGPVQRSHKAFSLNPDLKFLARKVMVATPLTSGMRDSVRCVSYTALPRDIIEEREEISDPKGIGHANEAEIRVPDGTGIPHGTVISVQGEAKIDKSTLADLQKWCTVKI